MPDEINPVFEIASGGTVRLERIARDVPVLIVDNFYQTPASVRLKALDSQYQDQIGHYPGRTATLESDSRSLRTALSSVLALVNDVFLPRVNLSDRGRDVVRFDRVDTDFAIVDRHPDELTASQKAPHVDPVPLFGLVYLNEEDRGGTLFFEAEAIADRSDKRGYPSGSDPDFRQCGRIAGRFNRLAIYPGFIPHSAEIAGDWIKGDTRFLSPRVTQRFIFRE